MDEPKFKAGDRVMSPFGEPSGTIIEVRYGYTIEYLIEGQTDHWFLAEDEVEAA